MAERRWHKPSCDDIGTQYVDRYHIDSSFKGGFDLDSGIETGFEAAVEAGVKAGFDFDYHSSSDWVDVLSCSKAQNSTDFPAARRSRVAKAENVEMQLPM